MGHWPFKMALSAGQAVLRTLLFCSAIVLFFWWFINGMESEQNEINSLRQGYEAIQWFETDNLFLEFSNLKISSDCSLILSHWLSSFKQVKCTWIEGYRVLHKANLGKRGSLFDWKSFEIIALMFDIWNWRALLRLHGNFKMLGFQLTYCK